MGKQVKIDLEELERLLEYLQDKVEDCYKKETERAIRVFKRLEVIGNGKTN